MMRTRFTMLPDIIAAFFILLFTYTALSKLGELNSFRIVLKRSPLLERWAPVLAWLIPFIELIIAGLLFFISSRLLGLTLSFGLMSVFTLYTAYMILFTTHLPCSCGGVLKQLSWKEHLFFNIGCTCLSVLAIWLRRKRDFPILVKNTT
jgi:hypothetical protein